MRKFRQTDSPTDLICPYCGHSELQKDWGLKERCIEPVKCSRCQMIFAASSWVGVTHYGEPNCALNSLPHDYRLTVFNDGTAAGFCDTCGDCKPHKDPKP